MNEKSENSFHSFISSTMIDWKLNKSIIFSLSFSQNKILEAKNKNRKNNHRKSIQFLLFWDRKKRKNRYYVHRKLLSNKKKIDKNSVCVFERTNKQKKKIKPNFSNQTRRKRVWKDAFWKIVWSSSSSFRSMWIYESKTRKKKRGRTKLAGRVCG